MSNVTCWTVIRGAAAGRAADREAFAARYLPVVRAYLGARWRRTPLQDDVDDAAQEVFLECFRPDGALSRADPARPGGFRAFLYGVARNVARRVEERRGRRDEELRAGDLDEHAIPARTLSEAFDRAWAESVMRQARDRQAERARERGPDAEWRVELLRLRFEEELPIREIARRRGEPAARVHHAYATARREFREALRDVVAFHHPGDDAELEREAARLLAHFA